MLYCQRESVSNEELVEETEYEKVKENEKEEGEILAESVQGSQENEPGAEIAGNGNVEEEIDSRTRRSAPPRQSRANTKNLKDQKVLSTKETISSTVGRKKNTKKK